MADYQDIFVERFDPDRPDAVRVPRRVAARRGAARDDPGPRRTGGRRHDHGHAPRPGRSRRPGERPRRVAPLHGDGRAEPDVRRVRPDAPGRLRRRARGGHAAVGRSGQQPGLRRRPRDDRLPDARARARPGPARTRGCPSPAGTAPTSGRARSRSRRCPRCANPAAGWIATANSRIVDDDYPHYLGLDYAPDFRTRRLVSPRPGPPRARRSPTWRPSTRTGPRFPPGAWWSWPAASSPSTRARARRSRCFAAGTARMDADSAAATVYAAFRARLVRDVLGPLLGPLAADAFAAYTERRRRARGASPRPPRRVDPRGRPDAPASGRRLG